LDIDHASLEFFEFSITRHINQQFGDLDIPLLDLVMRLRFGLSITDLSKLLDVPCHMADSCLL